MLFTNVDHVCRIFRNADFDGNETINTADFFAYFRPQFGGAPGPGVRLSALAASLASPFAPTSGQTTPGSEDANGTGERSALLLGSGASSQGGSSEDDASTATCSGDCAGSPALSASDTCPDGRCPHAPEAAIAVPSGSVLTRGLLLLALLGIGQIAWRWGARR